MGTNLGHRFLDWLSWSYGCRLSLTSLMVSTCLWPLPLLFTAPLASTHWALTSHTFLGESLPPPLPSVAITHPQPQSHSMQMSPPLKLQPLSLCLLQLHSITIRRRTGPLTQPKESSVYYGLSSSNKILIHPPPKLNPPPPELHRFFILIHCVPGLAKSLSLMLHIPLLVHLHSRAPLLPRA